MRGWHKLRRRPRAALYALASLMAPGAVADNAIENPYLLDDVLSAYVDDGLLPFIYARIEDGNGRVIYEHRSVDDTLLPDVEIDGQTWIRIWSMSKIVTTTVLMDLVEDGVLSLDDAVADYLPEFADLVVATGPDGQPLRDAQVSGSACPFETEPIAGTMTVRDLLNHTAGFYYAVTGIDCLDEAAAASDLPGAADSDELIRRLAALPLIQQPGSGYYYGTSTTVLGLLAERATGQTLAQLVAARITGPAKIRGLRYGLPDGETLLPRISGADGELRFAAPGELDLFGGSQPPYATDSTLYLGGEGMLATADGYCDFLRIYANGGVLNDYRVLAPETIAEITARQTLTDDPSGHNGYNLWITTPVGERIGTLWVGGGYEGSQFWVDPARGFVAVLMTQVYAAPPGADDRFDEFRDAVYEVIESY